MCCTPIADESSTLYTLLDKVCKLQQMHVAGITFIPDGGDANLLTQFSFTQLLSLELKQAKYRFICARNLGKAINPSNENKLWAQGLEHKHVVKSAKGKLGVMHTCFYMTVWSTDCKRKKPWGPVMQMQTTSITVWHSSNLKYCTAFVTLQIRTRTQVWLASLCLILDLSAITHIHVRNMWYRYAQFRIWMTGV